jgi:hypothetical protein
MGPSPACSFPKEIHNFFSQTRQRLARSRKHFFSDARAQVCYPRSFWVALIISNNTSRIGESWDC